MGSNTKDKQKQLQCVFAATLKALSNEHPSKTPVWERLGMKPTYHKSITNGSAAMSPSHAFNMAQTFSDIDIASVTLVLSVLWALKDAKDHELESHFSMALKVIPAFAESLQLIAERLATARNQQYSVHMLSEHECHKPLHKFLKTPYPTKPMETGDRTAALQHLFRDLPSIYYSDLMESIKASRSYPRHYDEAYSERWEKEKAEYLVQFYGMFSQATFTGILLEENIKRYNGYRYLLEEDYVRSCFLVESDANPKKLEEWKKTFVKTVCKVNGVSDTRKKAEVTARVVIESTKFVEKDNAQATKTIKALRSLFVGHDILWSFRSSSFDNNWVAFKRRSGLSEINGEVMTLSDCDQFVQLMEAIKWGDAR